MENNKSTNTTELRTDELIEEAQEIKEVAAHGVIEESDTITSTKELSKRQQKKLEKKKNKPEYTEEELLRRKKFMIKALMYYFLLAGTILLISSIVFIFAS